MERIPKLLDTLDSVLFALRLAWYGYAGTSVRGLAGAMLAGLALAQSPVLRHVAIATVAAFLLAEFSYRVAARPGPAAVRDSG